MTNKPETQMVAITQRNGTVAVMQFVTKEIHNGKVTWEREATDEAIEAEIARSARIDAVSWRRIEPGDVPQDRHFRGAWKDDGKSVGVDMPKARDIHRDRMRAARAPELAKLDIEYQRADERSDGDAKNIVATRKQALRDVTADPAIEAAKTADELRAVWPSILRQPA
jgi:hypothetical protein